MKTNRCDGNLSQMNRKPARGLLITGTDTGVGKTYVAAGIARALHAAGRRVGVYKPVASGCPRQGDRWVSEDAVRLWEAAGRPGLLEAVCPQVFAAPLAPHLAAKAEGRELDAALLGGGIEAWADSDIVLVEGAGGLMCPLGDELYLADLALGLEYPLIVVAPNQIGVISQTLQTLITAMTFREGLSVAGVVLNDVRDPAQHPDPSRASNRSELEQRCVPPVLTHVGWQEQQAFAGVDWWGLAQATA